MERSKINYKIHLVKNIFVVPLVAVVIISSVSNHTIAQERSEVLEKCMFKLMYKFGIPIDDQRTDVNSEAAAFVCEEVSTIQEAEAIRKCMFKLMYKFGIPIDDQRTDVSSRAAARACHNI
jgi:hypothetical protein